MERIVCPLWCGGWIERQESRQRCHCGSGRSVGGLLIQELHDSSRGRQPDAVNLAPDRFGLVPAPGLLRPQGRQTF